MTSPLAGLANRYRAVPASDLVERIARRHLHAVNRCDRNKPAPDAAPVRIHVTDEIASTVL